MPFSSTGLQQMLDGLNYSFSSYSPQIYYASLHTAYSATGGSEVSGGSYARVQLGTSGADWSAATNAIPSVKALGTAPSAFNVPAATTVAYIGFWSASTSGTFAGMGPNGGATQYAFTVTLASPGVFTAPGSSYTNGQTVVVFNAAGATVPSAFTVGTIYYVVSASGATFELSATSGGSAINTAAAGAGLVQAITTESFGAAGTFTLTTSTQLTLT
jgi:hypothetical protein